MARTTAREWTPAWIRVTAVAAAAAFLVGACSSDDSASTTTTAPRPTDESVTMNELQFIGTHNSYKSAPSAELVDFLKGVVGPDAAGSELDPAQLAYGHRPLTQQLDSGIRSFELDVWADPTGGRFSDPLAVKVLAQPSPTGTDEPGFKVLHIQEIDYLSTCPTLVGCLQEMVAWSDAHPDHLPITVNLELKSDPLPSPFDVTPIQPFDAATLDALDADLRTTLGDRLITPDEVRGSAPDLRSAVTDPAAGGGWPSVEDSRGRFLLFMDNGGELAERYLAGHPSLQERVLFTSDGFDRDDAAVLKVNDPGDGTEIESLVQEGFLVRTRADADVAAPGADKDVALASGAQMVHTDFPVGEAQAGTGYVVSFPTPVQARCNPVNTTPTTCSPKVTAEP